MSLSRKQFQFGIGFATVVLFLLNSGCNSSVDSALRDSSVGTAARITVFYPDFFEDSANEIFTQTRWAVDSNLIRFEENLDMSNDAYYEAQFEFELHNFSQMQEEDIATKNNMQSAPLVWIIDPKSKFEDINWGSYSGPGGRLHCMSSRALACHGQVDCTHYQAGMGGINRGGLPDLDRKSRSGFFFHPDATRLSRSGTPDLPDWSG